MKSFCNRGDGPCCCMFSNLQAKMQQEGTSLKFHGKKWLGREDSKVKRAVF